MAADRMEQVTSLARRRGFAFVSSEIYGAGRPAYDYGPLGVELKDNVRRQWWNAVVRQRDDVVGLDSAVILAPQVWAASGHLEEFVERVVDCQSCKQRLPVRSGKEAADVARGCPACGNVDTFGEPQTVSRLVGASFAGDEAWLRAETSQGAFVNYRAVETTARRKPPFGIAQVGRAFRTQLGTGHFLYDTREFDQLAVAYFVPPGTDLRWHEHWLAERWAWYTELGLKPDDLRYRERPTEDLPHYSRRTVDIEYRFELGPDAPGFALLEEVANRADVDLSAHSRQAGADLTHFDQERSERWIPYVIEPAASLDRAVLAFLLAAYDEDSAPNTKGGVDRRVVLRLDPRLAPVKVAVLPLSRNAELSPRARALAATLRRRWNVDFDDAGAIGRRYRRQDEVGTPFCVTVDFGTLEDGAVTVRDRDSMAQERVSLDRVETYLLERLPGA